MLHPSTKRLIDKLGEMTGKQRVAWIEGEDDSVVHDTEGYRVVLTPEPHAMLLTDALGREIETCRPEEFADEKDADGRPYAQFIAELYREAHRHARGTERAIRTLLAGLEAADAPAALELPPPEPAPPEPDMTTDETAQIEGEADGEGAITAAVATMADQVNKWAPADPAPGVAPETAPETAPEPTYESAPKAQPEPDTAASETPEAAPEDPAAPEPAPEEDKPASQASAPSGPMQQRFSLSGIPYTSSAPAAAADPAPEPKPVPARTLIIDGTEDLPDIIPGIPDPPKPANLLDPRPDTPDTDEESGAPGGSRFNPWN